MTSHQAKEEYRNCWNAWRAMQTEEGRIAMEQEMDRLQPMVSPGPGPIGDEFTATLPGYREHWATFAIDAADSMLKRIEKEPTDAQTGGGGSIRCQDP